MYRIVSEVWTWSIVHRSTAHVSYMESLEGEYTDNNLQRRYCEEQLVHAYS